MGNFETLVAADTSVLLAVLRVRRTLRACSELRVHAQNYQKDRWVCLHHASWSLPFNRDSKVSLLGWRHLCLVSGLDTLPVFISHGLTHYFLFVVWPLTQPNLTCHWALSKIASLWQVSRQNCSPFRRESTPKRNPCSCRSYWVGRKDK